MVTCRSCGNTFAGNFCTRCGAPAVAAIRCPRCNNVGAPGTAFCAYCGTALTAQAPQNAPYQQVPPQPQQQNNAGKYLMGALGGAAAVIGGEILLHDLEEGAEHHREREWERREWERREWGEGFHHHHHHHHHRR